MRLIITRHGETEENKLGIMMGHLPGILSKAGVEQAKKLAKELKKEKIDYIYSSDLLRAVDTAREISKRHPNIPIRFVKNLRERHLGEFQGRNEKDFDWNSDYYKAAAVHPKGGESIEELFNRVKKFLDSISVKHKNKTVLLVAHNGTIRALTAVITGKSSSDILKIEGQKNTGIITFEINKNKTMKSYIPKTHTNHLISE